MITFTKIINWVKFIYKIEIVQFILPFTITVIGGYLNNGKALSYQVTIPHREYAKEKIWKQKIAIYNNGETFIEKQDFAGTDNIKLNISGINKAYYKLRIISNRKPIKLKWHFDSLNPNLILLNLLENEVFEMNDCFIVNLIYYSPKPLKIWVSSRIKGVKIGLVENYVSGKEKNVLLVSLIIFLMFVLIIFFRIYRFKKRGILIHLRPFEIIIGGIICGFTVLFIYEYNRDFETYEYINNYLHK